MAAGRVHFNHLNLLPRLNRVQVLPGCRIRLGPRSARHSQNANRNKSFRMSMPPSSSFRICFFFRGLGNDRTLYQNDQVGFVVPGQPHRSRLGKTPRCDQSINRLSIHRPSGNCATCSLILFRRLATSIVEYALSGLSSLFKRSAISDANSGSFASPRIRRMRSS